MPDVENNVLTATVNLQTRSTMDIVLQNFDYNGRVISRRNDGFINLTQMCQANGKQINDFFRLKSTKEYLEALETETGIPVTGLYQVFQGGTQNQGTWGHPMVALRLAQWISPAFAVWCDAHIFNLMSTGSTSLEIDPIEEMKLKIELARLEDEFVTTIPTPLVHHSPDRRGYFFMHPKCPNFLDKR